MGKMEMNEFEDKLRVMGCRVQAWRDAGGEDFVKAPPIPEPGSDLLENMQAVSAYFERVIPPRCDCLGCRALREDPSVAVVVLADQGPLHTTLRRIVDGEDAPGEDGNVYLVDTRVDWDVLLPALDVPDGVES